MENNLLPLNANFVVILEYGFAGGAPIFVMTAIKDNKKDNIFPNFQNRSFQNAKESKNVRVGETMGKMVHNLVLAVCFAKTIKKRPAVFDLYLYVNSLIIKLGCHTNNNKKL